MSANLREFMSWFDGSAVRDSAGLPALVHHQTWNDFEDFDRLAAVKQWGRDPEKINAIGCWFTDSANATKYGPKNIDVCLAIRAPITYTDEPGYGNCAWSQLERDIKQYGGASKFREYLTSEGVDGIKLEETFLDSETQTIWIALEPGQIRRMEPAEHSALLREIAQPVPHAAKGVGLVDLGARRELFAMVETRERLAAYAHGLGRRFAPGADEGREIERLGRLIERVSGEPLEAVREDWRMWREAQRPVFAQAQELQEAQCATLYAAATDLHAGEVVDIILRRDGLREFPDSAVRVAIDGMGVPSVRAISAPGNSSTYEYTALRPVAHVDRFTGLVTPIDGGTEPSLVGLTKWDLVTIDQRPGHYYASAKIPGGGYAPLVGPFATHVEALMIVGEARRAAERHYGESRVFSSDMSFGTFRAPDDVDRPARGVLNAQVYRIPVAESLERQAAEIAERSADCPEAG